MSDDKRWVAGWNMAGYLPDVEHVLHGLELDEAVDYLKEELERAGDQDADRDEAEAFDRARERVSAWDLDDMRARARIHGIEQNSEHAGGHVYWVTTCSHENCQECGDGPALTPILGATPVYDEDGNEIVTVATCGHCGRSWNDAAVSSLTPAPSARCPFEYEHA